jgi:hypothetical protein
MVQLIGIPRSNVSMVQFWLSWPSGKARPLKHGLAGRWVDAGQKEGSYSAPLSGHWILLPSNRVNTVALGQWDTYLYTIFLWDSKE